MTSDTPQPTPQPEQTGPPFSAPEHPDYQALLAILNDGLDARAAQEGFDLEAFVAEYADPQSVAYVALQRIVRAYQIPGPKELAEQLESLMRVSALYMEAFAVGAEWGAGR